MLKMIDINDQPNSGVKQTRHMEHRQLGDPWRADERRPTLVARYRHAIDAISSYLTDR